MKIKDSCVNLVKPMLNVNSLFLDILTLATSSKGLELRLFPPTPTTTADVFSELDVSLIENGETPCKA